MLNHLLAGQRDKKCLEPQELQGGPVSVADRGMNGVTWGPYKWVTGVASRKINMTMENDEHCDFPWSC